MTFTLGTPSIPLPMAEPLVEPPSSTQVPVSEFRRKYLAIGKMNLV